MLLLLTNGRNGACGDMNCKQNDMYGFQIINLSFTGRKWPTFNAKVAEFFVVNGRFFYGQSQCCVITDVFG